MKRLTKIPSVIWFIVSIVFSASIAFTFFLINFKVEESFETQVSSKNGFSSIYVNSNVAYKLIDNDIIHLHINGKTYSAVIAKGGIEKVHNKDLYRISLEGLKFPILPGSIINATIITGTQSIGSILFGSV